MRQTYGTKMLCSLRAKPSPQSSSWVGKFNGRGPVAILPPVCCQNFKLHGMGLSWPTRPLPFSLPGWGWAAPLPPHGAGPHPHPFSLPYRARLGLAQASFHHVARLAHFIFCNLLKMAWTQFKDSSNLLLYPYGNKFYPCSHVHTWSFTDFNYMGIVTAHVVYAKKTHWSELLWLCISDCYQWQIQH